MSVPDDSPIISSPTTAQNEAVETVLTRLDNNEIRIPEYQRDSDEWDDVKKSIFIESILNRLTVPAFYLAPSEAGPDLSEVVDGQQRLTTLNSFYKNQLQLQSDEKCPYFGKSVHYAGKFYKDLHDNWQKAFRRYNLTLVVLPQGMPLNLRLEIFRRINEGGTPLSAQDIRLSYYSESKSVRYIQLAGIYDEIRSGSKRMIEGCKNQFGFGWPWENCTESEKEYWTNWWTNSKTATGQTASEMFLWYVISRCKENFDKILQNENHMRKDLNMTFHNTSEEALNVVCTHFRYQDRNPHVEKLLPSFKELSEIYFPTFRKWWFHMRNQCVSQVNVSKYRSVALLIHGMDMQFGGDPSNLSDSQWGELGKFISATRNSAIGLNVDFPEPKGRWNGDRGQRAQLDAFDKVAAAIKQK
jgi:hypothetical protein